MSIAQEILYILHNYPGGYKILYNILYSDKHGKDYRNVKIHSRSSNLRNTLSRLKKRGLVSNKDGIWKITLEGKNYIKNNKSLKKISKSKVNRNTGNKKRIVLIFDVPEEKRNHRNWLRGELIGFGFEMIQKSVWFGPVLPETFIEYLSEVGILENIRFFEVTKENII